MATIPAMQVKYLMSIYNIFQRYSGRLWLIICTCFCALFWWHGQYSLNLSISQQLQQQLPLKLKNALYYSDKNSPVTDLIHRELEQDLSSLQLTNAFALFNQCQGKVVHLMEETEHPIHRHFNAISIVWMLDNNPHNTLINLQCDTYWPAFAIPVAFASLFVVLIIYLPSPVTERCRKFQQYLVSQGIKQRETLKLAKQLESFNPTQYLVFEQLLALHLNQPDALIRWLEQSEVSRLTAVQLAWLQLAISQFSYAKEQALVVALADDQLQFAPQNGQVFIRGIPFMLAKTPYLYYLWYAYLRKENEGWQLNPPVNRAAQEGAATLISLMQTYGGHTKAINDLLENGLRAKTLDQNRNKLKIELSTLLGDTLAKPYLFDTERDVKTGRYRYRLALDAQHIHLPAIKY